MMPATALGHMNQKRQNILSTKNEIKFDLEDYIVTPASLGLDTHSVYTVVIDQGQLYNDLMGIFPVRSSKINWYVMVGYSYYCNYMNSVPMKSRSASEWLKAYSSIHQELIARFFKPKPQKLDNDASSALKSHLTENKV
jgi:hypothetical protein